jgi:antirestriction protein ArdC
MKQKKEKKDSYQVITDKVIELLEKGIIPWKKPWRIGCDDPRNFITKKSYQGINALLLHSLPYDCNFFATYKQIKEKGGKVKKGEHGFPVIFWKIIVKDKLDKDGKVELDENGNVKKNRIYLLRYYTVFNLEQQEGIEIPKREVVELNFNPIKKAESIIRGYKGKPKIECKVQRACYYPSTDKINMPKKETFDSVPEYYSVLFHESVHSTGHKKRLNRDEVNGFHFFGDDNYSKEELVAEFGATFLCAEANIKCESTLKNSVAYLQSWISKLQNDKKFLISASARAQKAVRYILGKKDDVIENNGEEK